METKKEAVLTPKETAKVLRCGENQVYAGLNRGEIPGFKVGGMWKIPRAALEKKLAGEA